MAALDRLLARQASTKGNVVLALRARDIVPFPAFFRTGFWNFEKGEGPEAGFERGVCGRFGSHFLRCGFAGEETLEVDLENGRASGGRWLRRVVEVRDGGEVVETEHARGAPITLELMPGEAAGTWTAYLVSEPVFRSNFNQLFFLGRFDPARFEMIHDDPPVLRAYRIRATVPANRPASNSAAPYDRRMSARHESDLEPE